MSNQNYIGRFAPSPTGPVHYGTLVAAVASYLQAKKNNGKWLLRIDDIDTLRTVNDSDTDILSTLEQFGFEWDGEIIYQTNQIDFYLQALDKLISKSAVFPCLCSRKQLAKENANIYPGTCRHRPLPESEEHALRITGENVDIGFIDAVMGKQSQNIKQQCGDFIIKRRDGLFAYQLAVVVDDAIQGITEVVRGIDLLDSTPRQIYLQQQLNYATPSYCHLPLAVNIQGDKISKSAGAAPIDIKNKEILLLNTLHFLGQNPPEALARSNINDIWFWAIKHWETNSIPKVNKQILV